MANMPYCRFRNTLGDLEDCIENFREKVSREEHRARLRMLEAMVNLLSDAGVTIDESEIDYVKERLEETQNDPSISESE